MRKRLKKTIAVLLAVLLCCSVLTPLPVSAFAAETNSAVGARSGRTGDCTWTIDNDGTLTISGNGNLGSFYTESEISHNYCYTYTTAPWGTGFSKLVIKDGVTNIGTNAFCGCTRLKSVTIPASVKNIGTYAFSDCTALKSVIISDIAAWCKVFFHGGANPLQYGADLYLNDEKISELVIPDSVKRIGKTAFYNCKSLTSVTIPDSVTEIGERAFSGCTGLKSVKIKSIAAWCGITFHSVANPLQYGADLYLNDKKISELVIPDGVTSIGKYAFYGYKSLTSVTIPDSVTSIGSYAFYGCTGLKSVKIKDLSAWCNIFFRGFANPLYNGADLYLNDEKISELVIPDGVTSINSRAFFGCKSLTSVTVPASVKSIGEYAFNECTGLKEVYISDLAAWCEINFGNSVANPLIYAHKLYLNDRQITDLAIPEGVTKIGDYAFIGCAVHTTPIKVATPDSADCTIDQSLDNGTSLKSFTIPDSVTSIGKCAFKGCFGLTNITIPGSVESIGDNAFRNCTGLTSATIGSGVKNIGYEAFSGCTEMTKVIIPNSVEKIGSYAFGYYYENDNRKKLQPFAIYGEKGIAAETYAKKNGIEYIEIVENRESGNCKWSFDGTTLTISGNGKMKDYTKGDPAPWKNVPFKQVIIEDGVTSIGNYAFYGCSGMTSVSIPDSVTSFGNYAFYGCTGLKSVKIKDIAAWYGVTFQSNANPLQNGADLYLNDEKISELVIPDGVTSIGNYAFYGYKSLTSVTIPDSVTSIGSYAFYGCTGLKSVKIKDLSAWCNILFNGYANPLYNGADLYLNDEKISDLVIPDGVTSIGGRAFFGCKSLTSVSIPASVKTIGEFAFNECTELKEVHISDISAWCEINFENSVANPLIYAHKLYLNDRQITDLAIPDGTTKIGDYAFIGCAVHTTPIKVATPDSADCTVDHSIENGASLTSVTIPDSVTSIGKCAFKGCRGLTNAPIPDSVTSIGEYAFYGCTEMTKVIIPNSVEKIGSYAFGYYYENDNRKKLQPFAIFGEKGIAAETYANKNGIKYVVIVYNSDSGDCNWSFDGTKLTIRGTGKMADYGYENEAPWRSLPVKQAVLENGVTNIGDEAFYGCTGMTSVTIPGSVTSIGEYAFERCTGLTSVNIPDSVTSIGDNAFYGCTGMTKVTIPDSVTYIGNYAFGYFRNEYGDWRKIKPFTIYGKKGSAAETYANEHGIEFIEKTDPVEITDSDTGVSVTLTEDLELQVDDASDSESVNNIELAADEILIKALDITLLKDGEEIQPGESVTVKIPCVNKKAKVYHVEADDSLTDMNAVYEDGFMVFTTDRFSVFVVAAKPALIGDVNDDGKVNGADAGLLNRYTSGWEGYAEKIKNMDAADINRDGKVNGADSGLLNRYTSGWENVKKYFAA